MAALFICVPCLLPEHIATNGYALHPRVARGFFVNGLVKVFVAFAVFSLSMAIALAEDKPPVTSEPAMIFVLVRSSQAGCEPSCPQWIQAEGQIMGDTAIEFGSFMKKIGYRPYPILVNSGGGRVDIAMKMGRQIRKLKIDVAVGATAFSSCSPRSTVCKLPEERKGIYAGYAYSARSYCNSACPMIVAAGVRRVVGSWAYLGVHQVTTVWTKSQVQYKIKYRVKNGKKKVVDRKQVGREVLSKQTTTKLSPNQKLQITGYYKSMGVKPEIVDKMLATPASTILQLSQVEMLNLGLVTSLDQADLFTGQAICKVDKPAENCVLDKAMAVVANLGKPDATAIYSPKKVVMKVEDFVSDHPMWFAVVRSNAPGCEPVCPQWISAEGFVTPETISKFEEFVTSLKGKKLPMVMSSSGGSLDETIALARVVRKYQLNIGIGSTVFASCAPENRQCSPKDYWSPYLGVTKTEGIDTYCVGTCLVLLASGKSRLAGRANVGLAHPINTATVDSVSSSVPTENLADPDVKQKFKQYLLEQDVDFAAVEAELSSSLISLPQFLRMDTMIKSRLLNSAEQVDLFSSPSVCKKMPMPENCVKRLQ